MIVTLLYIFTVFAVVLSTSVAFLLEDCRNFLLRGGLVPQASNDGKYYEKFDIDYGCDDNGESARDHHHEPPVHPVGNNPRYHCEYQHWHPAHHEKQGNLPSRVG